MRDDTGWEVQLAKLRKYRCKHGDCNVPRGWAEDPTLANWVSDQRWGKKKLDRGDLRQGVMAARVAKLDAIGFAWVLSAVELSK
jgi:hypothetical protein